MKIKLILTLSFASLLFASCSHVYTPALYHQDIAYQPKPASFDSVKSANYVSGGLNAYTNAHYNDFLVSGQFNLSRGHVFNNFNLAYGVFGVFGDYQNSAIDRGSPNYFTDKFFGAVGGRASANFFVTSGKVDFRFIGVEMAYSHEYGSFADFRQYINTQPGYYADPRTDLFTVGLTTEVIFQNRDNNDFQHGIRFFLGTATGHNQLDDTFYTAQTATDRMFRNFFPKISYFIKFKNYFGTIETGANFFIRFGYKF